MEDHFYFQGKCTNKNTITPYVKSMKNAEMKELLTKSYFLYSGIASLAFHAFLLSLLLWNLLLCVIRLHHKCLWRNQEILTDDLGTDHSQDSVSDLPSHAPHPVFRLSFFFPVIHSPDSASCVLCLLSVSQTLYIKG